MNRDYLATFILDMHKWREPVEMLIEHIKSVIVEMGAEILEIKNLGIKNFARCPRRNFTQGLFVSIKCKAETSFNKILQDRIGLNQNVNRVIVECMKG